MQENAVTVCLSPNGPNVAELDAPPTRLLVATIRGVGVIERKDAGDDWTLAARALEQSHISSLAIVPGKPGIFAGAHSGGLFYSDDGAHWEKRMNGLGIDHVYSLSCRKAGDEVSLYAGTEPASLFTSRDLGLNWTELPALRNMPGADKWTFPPPPHLAHTKSLTFDRRDPGCFYACVEQGALLKTTDGGASWRELDSYYRSDDKWYRDIHKLISMPSNPDELFMSSGMGLYHSTDAGETWEKLTDTNFRIAYPDHILLSPLDENTMIMSGSATDPSAWRKSHMAHSVVMTSRDRGRTWALSSKGFPETRRANIEAMCVASWPGGFSVFVGDTDGAVWSSEDSAQSWTLVANGLAPVSKAGHFRFLQENPAAA